MSTFSDMAMRWTMFVDIRRSRMQGATMNEAITAFRLLYDISEDEYSYEALHAEYYRRLEQLNNSKTIR